MRILHAIVRTCRFFVPDFRKLIRDLFPPILFYVIGLVTGMQVYARGTDHDNVIELSMIAFVVIWLVASWARQAPDKTSKH